MVLELLLLNLRPYTEDLDSRRVSREERQRVSATFFSMLFCITSIGNGKKERKIRTDLVKMKTAIARLILGLTFEVTFIAIAIWAYHVRHGR
jgi:hypothetical protein